MFLLFFVLISSPRIVAEVQHTMKPEAHFSSVNSLFWRLGNRFLLLATNSSWIRTTGTAFINDSQDHVWKYVYPSIFIAFLCVVGLFTPWFVRIQQLVGFSFSNFFPVIFWHQFWNEICGKANKGEKKFLNSWLYICLKVVISLPL